MIILSHFGRNCDFVVCAYVAVYRVVFEILSMGGRFVNFSTFWVMLGMWNLDMGVVGLGSVLV